MAADVPAHLAQVACKVQVDEAGDERAAARLEGPPPQPVVHQQRLQHKGQRKGAQKAAGAGGRAGRRRRQPLEAGARGGGSARHSSG